MKIIIIDDDCLVTEALKTILQINADVEVVAVGLDGNDACRLYREYRPDVLLMDIRMKGMSGSIRRDIKGRSGCEYSASDDISG